jgi:hypothetical protein
LRRSILKGFGITLALILAWTAPAAAEGPGRYAVSGANPNGQGQYQGTAVLTQTGRGTWHMTWTIGTETFEGYGVGDTKLFSVAFSSGRAQGLAMYTLQPDGTYQGIWAAPTDTATGTETLTPR